MTSPGKKLMWLCRDTSWDATDDTLINQQDACRVIAICSILEGLRHHYRLRVLSKQPEFQRGSTYFTVGFDVG